MSWNSIVGQERVKEQMQVLLRNDALSHAYLFVGPEGVGKDACAIEIARALQCETGKAEACGVCAECLMSDTLQHPNLHLVFALPTGKNEDSGDPPLAKLSADDIEAVREQISLKAANPYHKIRVPRANGYKVSSIRELRRQASMSARGGGKKVFILLDAENLTDTASNALLKTLEEPLPDTLLILTTTDVSGLLPTIVSRCQVVRFDPLSSELIAQALQQRASVDADRVTLISHLSAGSYGRALEFAESNLDEIRDGILAFLRTVVAGRRSEIISLIDEMTTEVDRNYLRQFLFLLQSWLRDAMIYGKNPGLIVNVKDLDPIRKFSEGFPAIDYEHVHLLIERSISHLSKNVYIPLSLTHLALELRAMIHAAKAHDRTSNV